MNLSYHYLANEWLRVGHEHFGRGNVAEAERCYRHAYGHDPMSYGAINALGAAAIKLERATEAIEFLERAVQLDPTGPAAWANLAGAYYQAHRFDEAVKAAERSLATAPNNAEALMNLGSTLSTLGRMAEAADAFERIVEYHPTNVTAHTNAIFMRDLLDTNPERALKLRQLWSERHGAAARARKRIEVRDHTPDRPLRVGYLGADFKMHSAQFVTGPIVFSHTPAIRSYVYSNTGTHGDQITEQLKKHPGIAGWRDVMALSDAQLAELIRHDQIDILVDLGGHTAGTRLQVFCEKPAPIQVHAWGYAHGTGIPEIDYMFGDPVAIPAAIREHYSEQIIDLPCIVPYAPVPHTPPVNASPFATQACFTFGSLNRIEKLAPEVIPVWAEILQRVPDSRLVLKSGGFQRVSVVTRVLGQFAQAGIGPEQLTIGGETDHRYHLQTCHAIDVALDPFPHCGGVTSLEALWMGLPTVTLAARRPGGRTTASVLTVLGLADWIAETPAQYVDLAVRAAKDRFGLDAIRSTLRSRMQQSPVMTTAYRDAVESAYRAMWRRWCDD